MLHKWKSKLSKPTNLRKKLSPTFIFFFFFAFQRSSCPEVFYKKSVLRNFTKFTAKTYAKVSFLIQVQAVACIFFKKKLTQVFSYEFCKTSQNFSYRTPPVAASDSRILINVFSSLTTSPKFKYLLIYCIINALL